MRQQVQVATAVAAFHHDVGRGERSPARGKQSEELLVSPERWEAKAHGMRQKMQAASAVEAFQHGVSSTESSPARGKRTEEPTAGHEWWEPNRSEPSPASPSGASSIKRSSWSPSPRSCIGGDEQNATVRSRSVQRAHKRTAARTAAAAAVAKLAISAQEEAAKSMEQERLLALARRAAARDRKTNALPGRIEEQMIVELKLPVRTVRAGGGYSEVKVHCAKDEPTKLQLTFCQRLALPPRHAATQDASPALSLTLTPTLTLSPTSSAIPAIPLPPNHPSHPARPGPALPIPSRPNPPLPTPSRPHPNPTLPHPIPSHHTGPCSVEPRPTSSQPTQTPIPPRTATPPCPIF